jgi:peptidoglycan hydrolase-like protein with peptidoglycan-binding domain
VIAEREAKRMPRDHVRRIAVVGRRHRMRRSRGVIGWLLLLLLTACAASQTAESTALRPATDRLLTRGDIEIAEEHLKAFGFDPGPVDGIFTAQTQAAVRAFQARYGSVVSGLLDRATREELKLGVDPKPGN